MCNMDEQKNAPINSKVIVRVSPDKRTAHAVVTAPQFGGETPSQQDIAIALREAGVIFGVKQETMQLLSTTNDYNKSELVAVAVMPVKGTDASIEYHFSAERDLRPRELPDGSVDFKDLGLVTNVKEDEPLCTKTPPGEGTSGRNVLGEPMPASFGKDLKLPVGPGTKISQNGLQLLAATNGQVAFVNRRVSVSDIFTVEKDVGIGTGNIDFDGNVRVKGDVTLGYIVKATGSVTVSGILDGGSVEAGGNVSVNNGFNGMQSGSIVSGGDVRCKYLQNGTVSAKGSIYTGHIVGCTVRSGATLNVSGGKSQIYNSTLVARDAINCINVGTESHAKPVIMEVGSDPELIQRKTANPKETAETEKKLHGIVQLYNIFAEREKRGNLPPDKVKDYEDVKHTMDKLKTRLIELEQEREDIEESMATMGYGTVVVAGNIAEGTHIIIGAERYILPAGNKFVRFKRDPESGGIYTAPAK
jgi:hypothetical protein